MGGRCIRHNIGLFLVTGARTRQLSHDFSFSSVEHLQGSFGGQGRSKNRHPSKAMIGLIKTARLGPSSCSSKDKI